MPGALQFDVRYDEAQLRRIVRAHVRRLVSLGSVLALAACAIGLAVLVRSGDRSWLVGVLAAAIVVGVSVPLLGWRLRLRHALESLRRLDPPTGHFVVDGAGLRVATSAGSLVTPWRDVTRVFDVGEAWIVQVGSHHVTVPSTGLDAATRQAFVAQVRAAGIGIG